MKDIDFTKDVNFPSLPDKRIRLRKRVLIERGEIKTFVLQLETETARGWLPIVRIDSFHGFAHKDEFFPNRERKRTPLRIDDLGDAFKYAEKDIKTNPGMYVGRWYG